MGLQGLINEWESTFDVELTPERLDILINLSKKKGKLDVSPRTDVRAMQAYIVTVMAGLTPVTVIGDDGNTEQKYIKSSYDRYLLNPTRNMNKKDCQIHPGMVFDEALRLIFLRLNSIVNRHPSENKYFKQLVELSKHSAALKTLEKLILSDDIKYIRNPFRPSREVDSSEVYSEKGDLDLLRGYIHGKTPITDIDGVEKKINSEWRLQLIPLAAKSKNYIPGDPNQALRNLCHRFGNRAHDCNNPGKYIIFTKAVEKILQEPASIKLFGERLGYDVCRYQGKYGKPRQPIP